MHIVVDIYAEYKNILKIHMKHLQKRFWHF